MNQHITASQAIADPNHARPDASQDVVRLVDLKRHFGATPAIEAISSPQAPAALTTAPA